MEQDRTFTAFAGDRLIASGPAAKMLPSVKEWFDRREPSLLVIFEDQTGRQVDFDLRGTVDDVLKRALPEPARSGPGRPKLGVISREVSLLPRHWEWLEQQPNGASAALRRLVDQARKQDPEKQRARLAMDVTMRFLSAMAGNLPNYEESARALYAANRTRFEDLTREWPQDIRLHARRLSEDAFAPASLPAAE